MRLFIAKRLMQAFIALFLMSIVVFFVARLTGDPVSLMISEYDTEEDIARITESLGLDRPLAEQYRIFLFNALRGDLGRSITGDRRPVVEIILERWPATVQLAVPALVIGLLIGLPLGILAAVKKATAADTSARVIALLGQSVPAFWLGIVLMNIFAVQLHLLPTSGYGGIQHYVLPVITLSAVVVATITRLVRSSMLDILDSEYIKLGRIKGLSEMIVIWKHALRNALIPVLTYAAMTFGLLLAGTIVIETVFSWPGLGRLAFSAALSRDFPVIQGVILFISLIFIVINLVVDILYAYVDPRIRY